MVQVTSVGAFCIGVRSEKGILQEGGGSSQRQVHRDFQTGKKKTLGGGGGGGWIQEFLKGKGFRLQSQKAGP